MKNVMTCLLMLFIFPHTTYAQEPASENQIRWGTNVEVTYISLLKKTKVGWYATLEYGSRFASNITSHLLLLEGGIVVPIQRSSSTILLVGSGTDYSFAERKLLPILNTSFESRVLGIGAKGIFENGVVIELTAIKYMTIGDYRLAIGGGYIFKRDIPLLKIVIPFER